MTDYYRLDGESDESLIFRVCKDKEMIGTWQDVADILNKLLGTDYGESTFRKKYAAFKQLFEANRDYFTTPAFSDEEIKRIEIEKIKLRDERTAWAAQNRVQARVEEKLDNLEAALSDVGRIAFTKPDTRLKGDGKYSMLVMLNDLHIGATFDNYFGTYDYETAVSRINDLLNECNKINKLYHVDEVVVSLAGDNISNSIHRSLQVTNRENVIDQIKKAVELISSFCFELVANFPLVRLVSVDGNHSRLDRKEDAIHEERLDSLIAWCVGSMLKHVENFTYEDDCNVDSGIAVFTIRGNTYVSVHGDYDVYAKSGVQDLVTMLRVFPTAVLFGHKHSCALSEANGIKMIQGGSLVGSGDQFTRERRISGKASQMVCICTDDGIEAYYPIELE